MGCDTLIVKKEPLVKEGNIVLPCHLAQKTGTIRDLVITTPVREEDMDSLIEFAKKKGVDRILQEIELTTPCGIKFIKIKATPIKPIDYMFPARVVEEKTIEEGVFNGIKYRIEEAKVTLCRTCPLFKPELAHGVFSPPCGIRTAVYEDIMPTITSDEIIPLTRIDELIKEVEENFEPSTPEKATEKDALLSYLRAIKEKLPPDEYVFFNWC